MAEDFISRYGEEFLDWLMSDAPDPTHEICWDCLGSGVVNEDGDACDACDATGKVFTDEVRQWRAFRFMIGCQTMETGEA